MDIWPLDPTLARTGFHKAGPAVLHPIGRRTKAQPRPRRILHSPDTQRIIPIISTQLIRSIQGTCPCHLSPSPISRVSYGSASPRALSASCAPQRSVHMDVLRRSESSERAQYSPGDLQQSVPSLSLILLLCDTSGDPLPQSNALGRCHILCSYYSVLTSIEPDCKSVRVHDAQARWDLWSLGWHCVSARV